MPTTDYITTEELKSSLELSGTGYADADIPRAIHAASRAIDSYCSRRFYVDDNTVARYYTLRESIIAIDDLSATPTEVAVSTRPGTWTTIGTAGSDYDLEPLNAPANDEPYVLLRALNWWPTYRYQRSTAYGNIRITGLWGWPEIPAQVPQACGILAAKLLVRVRQAPFGIVTAGADVGVAMRIAKSDPDVAALLDGLGRELLVV